MQQKGFDLNQCLFVGIDIHKYLHLAVATNRFEENLGIFEVPNDPQGIKKFVNQIEALAHHESLTTLFGVEDSRGNGEKLSQYLINQDSIVYEVNPVRTAEKRRRTLNRDKSDIKDAQKIVGEMTRKLHELPLLTKASENRLSTAINELSIYHEQLIKERTAIKNQLHKLFHQDNPNYRSLFKTVFSKKALNYWSGHTQRKEMKTNDPLKKTRAYLIREKIKRFFQIDKEMKKLNQKLQELLAQSNQKLETMPGIDTIIAAKVIGEVRDISRFRGPDSFVRYTGIAPKESQSGIRKKFIKAKTGNRRLNNAIYQIALTQIRCLPEVKEYYFKKISEGKTKKHAITCVMRRIAVILYGMLRNQGVYIRKSN